MIKPLSWWNLLSPILAADWLIVALIKPAISKYDVLIGRNYCFGENYYNCRRNFDQVLCKKKGKPKEKVNITKISWDKPKFLISKVLPLFTGHKERIIFGNCAWYCFFFLYNLCRSLNLVNFMNKGPKYFVSRFVCLFVC